MIVGSSELVAPMPPKRLPPGQPRSPGRRKRSVARWAAALLALACVGASPDSASSPAPPPSPDPAPAPSHAPEPLAPALQVIPPAARGFLHPTASRVPPFPFENPALVDAANWNRGGKAAGRVCALELRTYERGIPVTLSSLRERKSGKPLSARYLCAERAWRGPRYAGPFYVWNGDGSLSERSYRTTDGTRYREDLYQYRASGIVWAYRRRERNEDRTGPFFFVDEYYGPDGTLAGFSVDRSSGPDGDSLAVRWANGRLVDDAAFRKWAAEFPSN